jgi:hypothetical protein
MEKKRVRNKIKNNNGEARKELKVEGIKEKALEEIKVRDYTDIAREIAGLVKENYLMGFQLGLSLWEGNLKIMSSQIEQWVAVQEEYTTLIRELGKSPTEAFNFWSGNSKFVNNHVEKIIAFQKDYSSTAINTSDRLMKETLGLMRNSISRAFLSFNDYMNLIRS